MPNLLTILERGFYEKGKEELHENIRACVNKGIRTYLFVPEQETVTVEEEMASLLPDRAPLCFEVTNFTRFANTVFRFVGGLAGKSAGKAERALLMWRAMTELSPMLDITAKSGEVSPGAVRKMLAAVGEMQSLAITASDLDGVLQSELKDARLKSKLGDLSKVMALYQKLLREKYADSEDELDRMNEKLLCHPDLLSGAQIFMEGFTSLTEPQYATVKTLLSLCDVTVLLEMPKAKKTAFEYTELRECESRLLLMADKADAKKRIPDSEIADKAAISPISIIGDNLWSTSTDIQCIDNNDCQICDHIALYEAKSPYEECEFAASEIKRRVMEEGCRYSDFAILFRHAEAYAGIVDVALAEADIPIFFSRVREVNSFALIRMIESAYRTVIGGYQRKDLLSYAKCPLSGVSQDEADEFEIYSETWQLNGRRFIDGMIWNMNPAGYSTRRAKGTDEKLLRIDETKKKIVEPLRRLEEAARQADNVREQATALVGFLLSLNAEENLLLSAEALRCAGEQDAADETGNLFTVVCGILDTLVEVLGDTAVDTGTFLSLLHLLFAEENVGHIPSFRDAVTVGSADQIRLSGKKHLYLLGVSDGEFPETAGDHSFFTVRDRDALISLGLPFPADNARKNARELYCFSRAFFFASESVTLISSLSDASLSPMARGDVMDRICDLTGQKLPIIPIETLDAFERTYTPEYALEHLPQDIEKRTAAQEALREAGYGTRLRIGEGRPENDRLILSGEMAKVLYGNRMALTQSGIDRYRSCPMGYFCQYVLKLQREEKAEFDPSTVGSLLHAILEHFFRKAKEIGRVEGRTVADLTAEEKEKMIDDAARQYLTDAEIAGNHESARTGILCERLKRAAVPVINSLCDEFRDCSYQPVFFELAISESTDDSPEPAVFRNESGKEVFIYGTIDRVDSYRKEDKIYLRVIDYKTGKKEFAPEHLGEGENLQMFLYLKSLVETKNEAFRKRLDADSKTDLIPGGVIYVKSSVDDQRIRHADAAKAEEAIKKEQKRAGMLLNDSDSLSAMNAEFLPVKFDKNGVAKPEKLLYSEIGWGDLMMTVEKSVIRISDAMRNGNMSAAPKTASSQNSPCKHCSFKPFCRNVAK